MKEEKHKIRQKEYQSKYYQTERYKELRKLQYEKHKDKRKTYQKQKQAKAEGGEA
jgi:hypothetical protein